MPSITLEALRTEIRDHKLSPVYLFHGPDVRLMESMVDALEATIDEADRPFAVERLYAGEAGGSPVDVAAASNVFPMLGSRRVVILLRAEKFLKPQRQAKPGEAAPDIDQPEDEESTAFDTTPLEAYADSPAPFTTLVFVASGIDRTRRLTKKLVASAKSVEFGGLGGGNPREKREARQEAAQQVRREMDAAGRPIDPASAQLLVDRAGGDISKLRGDIERLLIYTEGRPRITKTDVEEVVSVETDIDDWAVVNAIGDGDVRRALREAALRFDRGDSPHMLVGQLRWWVSQKLAPAAPDRVKFAIDALLRTDLALKSSGGDDRILVERLVVELTGKPLPRQGW